MSSLILIETHSFARMHGSDTREQKLAGTLT